jgi:hypothetical protein
MVRLTTAAGSFEARLLAARLGAEGILWELRGNVDGPFAFGPVDVLVDHADLSVAQDILLADDVEAVFNDASGAVPLRSRDRWLVALVLVVAVAFTVARVVAHG